MDVELEIRVVMEETDTGFIVCTRIPLILGPLFVSPRYLATMLCDPMDRDDMENIVFPVLSSMPVPRIVGGVVLVSLNCMVPVEL
jgi:hypothetical protein